VELISVEQQEDLVHRVSLPNPCSYAHGFREKAGRRAKAQGAQSLCIIGCNQVLCSLSFFCQSSILFSYLVILLPM